MGDTYNVGGDPAWINGFKNIASLFDPKAEAEGATLLAKRRALDTEARYNAARAAGIEDQNTALGIAYLKSAGYTDQEIAAMRAARSNSVYDVAHGQNAFRGRTALEAGNPTVALPLLGQAAALDDYNKGALFNKVFTNTDGTFDRGLAAQFMQTPQNVGGNMVTFGPQGWTMGGATEQGKVYQGTVTNNANESAATVGLTNAKTEAVKTLGTAKVGTEEARTGKIEGDTANAAALTEGQLADIVARGATRDRVADARIETEQERAARIKNGAAIDTAKGNAAVTATNAKAAGPGNALDNANKQGQVRKTIERVLDSAYSKRTNNNKAWALLDESQKRSIVDWATERAAENGGDLVGAIREAEEAHGVTGGTTEGETKGWITNSPNGVLSLNGFKPAKYTKKAPASPVADAVAPQTTSPQAAPATPAASGGPVRITNDDAGKAAFARLPSGTEFIDPQGNLRRKP
jgi:hypothetical protein